MTALGQLTLSSSFTDVAEAIVTEARRRGYSRDEQIAVLADAIQESNLRPGAVSPNGAWHGIYQQDTSYPGRDDPNENIRAFLDRLDVKRRSSGASKDPWLNVFWLQQRPGEKSASNAYANGRTAYLTEIKSRAAAAAAIVDRIGGTPVTDNRPDFNEINEIGLDQDANGNYQHASVRSQPPKNFFLHTQQGGGGDAAATDLSAFLRSTSGQSAVSYHYTIRQASDGGVTVVDVVDTDLYSWAVLNANVFSINLCFAGSYAEWTRDQWLQQSKAIDVAAYLAVQDARKYNFSTEVILPPYGQARQGISDHRYVTKCLGIGTHTDVGGPLGAPWSGFPWDVFVASVRKYDGNAPVVPAPVPVTPPPAAVKVFPKDYTDRELLEYAAAQLGPGDPAWKSTGMTLRDKVWSLGAN